MDADGACTTIPDPRLSLVTSALLCASGSQEFCYRDRILLHMSDDSAAFLTPRAGRGWTHRHQELVDDGRGIV